MNIFLTGCTSYIGRYLAISFINQGDYVIGTSRKNPNIKNKKFRFIKHDLSKSQILNLNKKIDFFIHVAGKRMSKGQKVKEYISSNIIVTYNVKKMIEKFKPKLTVYTSSRSIYGEIKTNVLKESTKVLNPGVYGQTKLLGEKILEEAGNTVSLRLSTVLGKGAPGWVFNTYKKLLLGKKIKMTNVKINNFIHVSNVFNIIDNYFKEFPKVRDYMDWTIEQAREKEYVETIMGRRRYLKDINARNGMIRAMAERNAINAPIQGSAADIIKIAMIEVDKEMQNRAMKSKMLLQVHDELVFDMNKDEEQELKNLVKLKMEQAVKLQVPLIVDIGEGVNWLDAH